MVDIATAVGYMMQFTSAMHVIRTALQLVHCPHTMLTTVVRFVNEPDMPAPSIQLGQKACSEEPMEVAHAFHTSIACRRPFKSRLRAL